MKAEWWKRPLTNFWICWRPLKYIRKIVFSTQEDTPHITVQCIHHRQTVFFFFLFQKQLQKHVLFFFLMKQHNLHNYKEFFTNITGSWHWKMYHSKTFNIISSLNFINNFQVSKIDSSTHKIWPSRICCTIWHDSQAIISLVFEFTIKDYL